MSGNLAADLGLGPWVWLFLTLLCCVTLFFKFSRFWSIRNLDLLLLFAPVPGLMMLLGRSGTPPWAAYVLLFLGSVLWLARCLIDLGLVRRPQLEPNLSFSGLSCLATGILGLLLIETVNLPVDQGVARNPADPTSKSNDGSPAAVKPAGSAAMENVLRQSPLPRAMRRTPAEVILARTVAAIAQMGLVLGLVVVGWRHFDRPIAGLAVATCYLILPYTRFAVVDGGQLVPAALIVAALAAYARPAVAGLAIGLAAGWMPATVGLIPLWAGFYRGRGIVRFTAVAVASVAICGAIAWNFPHLRTWGRVLGARSLAAVGLLPGVENPSAGSFWTRIDPVYRIPVLIAYFALVATTSLFPARKNLGELIALSAALLVASQFWYLDEGGTLVLLYLPLLLLMVFRPNLSTKRPPAIESAEAMRRPALSSLR